MSFITQFVDRFKLAVGRAFGTDVYKKFYFKAYPHITRQKFKEQEELEGEETVVLTKESEEVKTFIQKLKQYQLDNEVFKGEITKTTLKKAFNAFAKSHHPDKVGEPKKEECQRNFGEVLRLWRSIEKKAFK